MNALDKNALECAMKLRNKLWRRYRSRCTPPGMANLLAIVDIIDAAILETLYAEEKRCLKN